MTTSLAIFLFPSMEWSELLLVGFAAVMIFGGNLPEVAMRALAHLMRARRAVARMWRETGLEDELRRVRRDIEAGIPRDADFDVKPRPRASADGDARAAAERARAAARQSSAALDAAELAVDPDADRQEPIDVEPVEDAIASGDDWRPAGEIPHHGAATPEAEGDAAGPPEDATSPAADADAERRAREGSTAPDGDPAPPGDRA